MEATMQERAPTHLWAVGGLATLWNAFGCYDYLMTELGNEQYLAQFGPELVAYFESLPVWLTAFWALGVWGGLAGSILLLMRSRYAVHAFAVSLAGMIISFGYQFLATDMPAAMTEGMMILMPLLIVAVGVALYYYATRQRANGTLR